MICLLYAHPYPDRSRANRVLLSAVKDLPDIDVRSLYDLYPDFSIDVEVEQEALTRADIIVLQHPFYWYSMPALLKHWVDKVLALGWAYGDGGNALRGKTLLWCTTTGAPESGYEPAGMHERPFADFVAPIEQTARFCGMHWATPLVLYGAHRIGRDILHEHAQRYREQLVRLALEAAKD
ncbi:MAG: Glutathione-regulated potassium-efflux system ancillary protein KefF [Myxococcaceae bacterium]|nr:Glutathione-regulated potassium-efflux system ancillary protein KefF [Myxococcaceae bacterium]